jgi:predicted acylesterase/phospholipase RssA
MEPDVVDNDSVAGLLEESAIFSGMDPAALEMLVREFEPRLARRGEVVIRQGDSADGLYLVGSGRLQAVLTRADSSRVVLGEVGRGAVTGEMALITDHPRSATVTALRDSHLFFLASEGFSRVVQTHPPALRVIATALIDRLMDTIKRGPTTSSATSIAIVPLDEGVNVVQLAEGLATSLGPLVGHVRVVGQDDLGAELGDAPTHLARVVWRDRLEASHGAVIYVAEPTFGSWTDECVQQADIVLLAGSGNAPPVLRPVEHELRRREGPAPRRTELILMHEPATTVPRGTRNWLEARRVDRHHHIRVDRVADYDRVARLLVGRAFGVVFSGGGARGAAHIGVLRALVEQGVPIDAVGGASIGAIIAGAVARGDPPADIAAMLRASVVEKSPIDLTLPAVSFATGGRVTEHIREGADDLDLEDLWLNCFCVSTNLTRGALEVHSRGPAWTAVRSSFSVPGLFPPMVNPRGEVLVDGGLLDNLPVSPMRAAHAGITVIGIDVGTRREFLPASSVSPTGVLSGWRFLASSLRGRALDNLTTLPRLLMRLTELGSLGDDDRGDCYIRPALEGVSLLDFDKFDALIESGQRDAAATVAAWLASRADATSSSPTKVPDTTRQASAASNERVIDLRTDLAEPIDGTPNP